MPKVSIQRSLPPMEVNRVDRPQSHDSGVVNKVDRLPERAVDMARAKARVGHAVEEAIGNLPLKEFGDKGLMSKVTTGEKVPDYLARIYANRSARRRFARALVADDSGVVVTTVMTFREDEEKVG